MPGVETLLVLKHGRRPEVYGRVQDLPAPAGGPHEGGEGPCGGAAGPNPPPRVRHGQHPAADEEREGRPGPETHLRYTVSVPQEEHAAPAPALPERGEAGHAPF